MSKIIEVAEDIIFNIHWVDAILIQHIASYKT